MPNIELQPYISPFDRATATLARVIMSKAQAVGSKEVAEAILHHVREINGWASPIAEKASCVDVQIRLAKTAAAAAHNAADLADTHVKNIQSISNGKNNARRAEIAGVLVSANAELKSANDAAAAASAALNSAEVIAKSIYEALEAEKQRATLPRGRFMGGKHRSRTRRRRQ